MSKHINHFAPRTGTGHFAPAALPTSRRNCTGHLAARSGNTDFAAQRARANSRPRSGTGHLAPAAAICRPRPGCPAVDLPRTPLPSGRPQGPTGEQRRDGTTTFRCHPDRAWSMTSYSPTSPSIDSRMRSACPLCRAYSSIMCRITHRSETAPNHAACV